MDDFKLKDSFSSSEISDTIESNSEEEDEGQQLAMKK